MNIYFSSFNVWAENRQQQKPGFGILQHMQSTSKFHKI
ncbi:hypothetical protein C943_01594 [Mariniradius saccharolyticus AK6]|uniref:Uncharacterized protein n=1 Tax=Mariniradius saccharolyticus AK6 TaxID=1239962 RepID=M7XAV0_9BACT|nr:hypothetical protein C943_01594 [Mariniradius saccharolyticus AK6]